MKKNIIDGNIGKIKDIDLGHDFSGWRTKSITGSRVDDNWGYKIYLTFCFADWI